MENPAMAVGLRGRRPLCRGPSPLDLFECCDPWYLFSCRPRAAEAMTLPGLWVEGRKGDRAWIRDAPRTSLRVELNMAAMPNLSASGQAGWH